MDENLKKQQEHYDFGWRMGLQAGREQLGNLHTNLEFLAETDLLRPEDRILEVGCGIGSLVAELSRKGYDITGTDISREAIKYGLEKYSDIKLMVQPAEDLDFEDGAFDAVLSFDLFETLRTRSMQWRRYHPSLHSPGQLRRRMARHGFETRFVKMNPINEFTKKKLQALGLLGRVLRCVDFRRMPLVLQTNLYVVAHKKET
jgi:SAM-dependent methyltransferase